MNRDCEIENIKNLVEAIGWIEKEDDGAVTRLPASKSYYQAASKVAELLNDEGFQVQIDPVGNVIGTLNGLEAASGTIMCGSHLDTVQSGGLFDGTLGIAAAITCARWLKRDKKDLRKNLKVIGFQGEEGSDLGGTFGSRSMMGFIDLQSSKYLEILESYGFTKEKVLESKIQVPDHACFMELHIEQGKTLEEEQKDIGIVTGIVGITRYEIEIDGLANHAGTTAMTLRKDALVVASKIIEFIYESAKTYTNGLVATVGKLEVFPNAVAVIPGNVKMVLEIRHTDQIEINEFVQKVENFIQLIKQDVIDVGLQELVKKRSILCDTKLQNILKKSCMDLSYSWKPIASGAGHDGNAIGQKIPTAMIFVPSKDGISHSKEEWTDWEQALKGVEILYQAMLQVDKE